MRFPLLIYLILTDSLKNVFDNACMVSGRRTFERISFFCGSEAGLVFKSLDAYSFRFCVTPGLPDKWMLSSAFDLLIAGKIDKRAFSERFVQVRFKCTNFLLTFKNVSRWSTTFASVWSTCCKLFPLSPSTKLLCAIDSWRIRLFYLK